MSVITTPPPPPPRTLFTSIHRCQGFLGSQGSCELHYHRRHINTNGKHKYTRQQERTHASDRGGNRSPLKARCRSCPSDSARCTTSSRPPWSVRKPDKGCDRALCRFILWKTHTYHPQRQAQKHTCTHAHMHTYNMHTCTHSPTLPQPGAHVPQPFHPSPPKPCLVLRDTLCSCEAYAMRSKKRKHTPPSSRDIRVHKGPLRKAVHK